MLRRELHPGRLLSLAGLFGVAIALALVAAGLTMAASAPAAALCQAGGAHPPNKGSGSNYLKGVAATSACNAWAVGYYSNGTANQTLIEHWNGKHWKVQSSPNLGGSSQYNVLIGVAATSPTNAWAVGYHSNGIADPTLIERWNGMAWKA